MYDEWKRKHFFSLYEHLNPQELDELLRKASPTMNEIERMGKGLIFPQVSFLISRRPWNEETILNGTIGIA